MRTINKNERRDQLSLPVRYFCRYSQDKRRKCSESMMHHQGTVLELRRDETAFIMVDVWNNELESKFFGDVGRDWVSIFRGGRSLQERVHRITNEKIRPALDAARKIDLTVVHLPTEHVAVKYEQYHKRFTNPLATARKSDWPPAEFKKLRTDRILKLLYGEGAAEADELREKTYDDISKYVKPQQEDYIIATGEQLNQIFKEKRILNLIYVGFATNLCLFLKPGGLKEMWDRGYNIIVLRDCTTTVETCHFGTGLCDEIAIDWLEVYSFFTAESKDFINSCEKNAK